MVHPEEKDAGASESKNVALRVYNFISRLHNDNKAVKTVATRRSL